VRKLYEQGHKKEDVIRLFHFIDWLMALPEYMEEDFWQEIGEYEEEKKVRYVTSVERIGFRRGISEGRQQGLEQARIMLLEVLSIRFGAVSRELTGRIEQIADHKVLQELHRAALRCADVQEFVARLDETGGAENIDSYVALSAGVSASWGQSRFRPSPPTVKTVGYFNRPSRAGISGKQRPGGTAENSPVFQHRAQKIGSPLTRRYAPLSAARSRRSGLS
jgi:hypothetical protein